MDNSTATYRRGYRGAYETEADRGDPKRLGTFLSDTLSELEAIRSAAGAMAEVYAEEISDLACSLDALGCLVRNENMADLADLEEDAEDDIDDIAVKKF
jgi:hypothetical protein